MKTNWRELNGVTWLLEDQWVKVVVTCWDKDRPGKWVMSCPQLGVVGGVLHTAKTADEAKSDALTRLRIRLKLMLEAVTPAVVESPEPELSLIPTYHYVENVPQSPRAEARIGNAVVFSKPVGSMEEAQKVLSTFHIDFLVNSIKRADFSGLIPELVTKTTE
jgi:hypothetical protein